MDLVVDRDWKELFALAVAAKRQERHDEEMQEFYERLDRQQNHNRQVREKTEKEVETEIATIEQMAAFQARLDDFDTQTVHCLMENGEALDHIHEQLRRMLDNATVLPDGRHVFKTEDGRRVFDEHGAEVSHDTIDPTAIDDRHTKWEAFKAGRETETRLQTERHELLEFQTKVDEARTKADKGGLSKSDLDALGTDLAANAPPAVREKLGLSSPEAGRGSSLQAGGWSPAQQATPVDDPNCRVPAIPAPF